MNFSENKIIKKENKNQTKNSVFQISEICNKHVEVSFTHDKISSDGGILLLKEVENKIGIIDVFCKSIKDERHPSYIQHTINEILSQRVFQIAAGYEDANDCNSLKDDSILKMSVGKNPHTDKNLASQPTMTRFENSVDTRDLYNIAKNFVLHFVKSYDKEPNAIILDCDDTDDITHGQQELSVFNAYYDDNCFLPLHIYEGISGKLITTILKTGTRSKGSFVFSVLKRIINLIRKTWKKTIIIMRGDSHFCSPELMDWSAKQSNIQFLTGLTGNNALHKLSEVTKLSAEKEYQSTKKNVARYHSFSYKAQSWSKEQRVIVKVAVSSKGTDLRYIVTDMHEYRTQKLYELGYCSRGKMELYIKDHKTYLHSDRTSCHRWEANQLRLFLHSAAYVLIHTLQKTVFTGTEFYNSTMDTIQKKILKIAASVKEMKTKIKVELPSSCPNQAVFEKAFGIFEILKC